MNQPDDVHLLYDIDYQMGYEPEVPVIVSDDKTRAWEILSHESLKDNDFAQSLKQNLAERGFLTPMQLGYVLGKVNGNGSRLDVNEKGYPCLRKQVESIKPIAPKAVIDLKSHALDLRFKGLPPYATASECVETKMFPYMNFAFEYFNPVQSAFIGEIENDNNVVIAAATSAGKTAVCEMIAAYTMQELRKTDAHATVAYIAPLRALCKEKFDDWTNPNHPFSKCRLSVLTGDFILSDERKEELANADIIAMSSEMLGSRIRRNKTEKNSFLKNIKNLVVDESHLITTPDRGHNLESAIVKFTKVNPNCRIIFLSATMPNTDDLGEWLTKLNSKKTSILTSDYRPVKLEWVWEYYQGGRYYGETEKFKIAAAVDVVVRYPKDKFIVFVHSKKTGRKIIKQIRDFGIECEFHNADLEKEERQKIEASFRSKEPGSLRILVATSTLAMGLNMPARRVVIVGIHRGISKVMSLDIVQMGGRAGRVGLDSAGTAHVLINGYDKHEEIPYCQKVEPIRSQINDIDILGFHLVSEISEKTVKNGIDALGWFKRTLAYHQQLFADADAQDQFIIKTMDKLSLCGAIKEDPHNPKNCVTTPIGDISSWFYFSPFDVASWKRNFEKVLQSRNPTNTQIAWALGATAKTANDYPIKFEGSVDLASEINGYGLKVACGQLKHVYALKMLLNDSKPTNKDFYSLMAQYRMDMQRLMSAIQLLGIRGRYFQDLPGEDLIMEIGDRVRYGISGKGFELVLLPGIGKVLAHSIMGRNIFTCKDFVGACAAGQAPVTEGVLKKALPVAKEIARIGYKEFMKRRAAKTNDK